MYALSLTFEPAEGRLRNRQVTARQMHGLFYQVLGAEDEAEATRIHEYAPPKPFSLRRLADPSRKELHGFEFLSVDGSAASFAYQSWQHALQRNRPLMLGRQPVFVRQISLRPGSDPAEIFRYATPLTQARLAFTTLTTFRKGSRYSHFPLPVDLYRRPVNLWQRLFADQTPASDLNGFEQWLRDELTVTDLDIRTGHNGQKGRHKFSGFRGEITLKAAGDDSHLRLWSALTQMLPFCGAGYRTLHGYGNVDILEMKEGVMRK